MRPDLRTIAAVLAVLAFFGAVFALQHYGNRTSQPNQSASAAPFPASTSPATSSPATDIPSQSASVPQKTAAAPAPTVSTTTLEARAVASSGVELMHALVNIVCLSGDRTIPSISGSGVIIDSRGIILTAAHVAQAFLLQDYLGKNKMQCLIRSGSPARRAYYAEPIFVSSSWIHANPKTLALKSPTGNGEYDVALLAITATATSTPLPSSYPYMPISPQVPQSGEQVAIASYGAQYLTSSELNTSLYPILTFGTIQNRYTFTENVVDLFSVQGTAASQEGSSGGGIADARGQLIGVITTSSVEGAIKNRILNAVTISHLRETYAADRGQNLDTTLRNNSISSLIAGFHDESLQLGELLWNSIR